MLRRTLPLLVFCFGLAPGIGLQAQVPAPNPPAASPLPITAPGNGPYHRLAIPSSANAASQYADLRDLQVQNAAGLLVPFAWISGEVLPSEMMSTRAPVHAVPQAKEGAGGDIPIGLKLGADGSVRLAVPAPQSGNRAAVQQWIVDTHKVSGAMVQLTLSLAPSASGLFTVNVESSNDLAQWRYVSSQVQIARLKAGGSLIERLELELPSVRAKYLRISTEAGAPSLPLTGVMVDSVLRADAIAQIEWSSPIAATRCEATYCEYPLPRNVPLSSLRIALSQTNTLSPVTITGLRPSAPASSAHLQHSHQYRQTNPLHLLRHKSRDTTPAPTTQTEDQAQLASTVLYRLSAAKGEAVSLDIALDGDTYTSLRIKVASNVQLLGTPAPSIQIGSYSRSLVFLAQGAGPFRVVWLDPKDKTFALPLNTLIPNYKTGQVIEADKASIRQDSAPPDVKAASPAAQAVSAQSKPADAGSNKLWLWGMLGLALTLLSGMVYSLFRSFNNKEMPVA
jgi:Protein of unknown function (DUF3999)